MPRASAAVTAEPPSPPALGEVRCCVEQRATHSRRDGVHAREHNVTVAGVPGVVEVAVDVRGLRRRSVSRASAAVGTLHCLQSRGPFPPQPLQNPFPESSWNLHGIFMGAAVCGNNTVCAAVGDRGCRCAAQSLLQHRPQVAQFDAVQRKGRSLRVTLRGDLFL